MTDSTPKRVISETGEIVDATSSSQLSVVFGRHANAHRRLGRSNKLALHGRSGSPGETCSHDVLSGCHVDSNSLSFSKMGQALALYETSMLAAEPG
jgi:hypothetical protein